jgi:hypothetical protein
VAVFAGKQMKKFVPVRETEIASSCLLETRIAKEKK